MKFLFMDEAYADPKTPAPATILTGLLIPSASYPEIRARFYGLVNEAIVHGSGVIEPMPIIHASELFPSLGSDDTARFAFLEGVADLVVEHDLKIYRVGYLSTEALRNLGPESQVIALCFLGFLWSLENELKSGQVWPVMETDRTNEQDKQFALQVRDIGYLTNRLSPGFVSIDNSNLGELLYVTKASSLGALVDCVAYLRQAVYLRQTAAKLTPFKSRLSEIGDKLGPAIAFEEVVEMQFQAPPPGYEGKGPVRYAHLIAPSD